MCTSVQKLKQSKISDKCHDMFDIIHYYFVETKQNLKKSFRRRKKTIILFLRKYLQPNAVDSVVLGPSSFPLP